MGTEAGTGWAGIGAGYRAAGSRGRDSHEQASSQSEFDGMERTADAPGDI